MLIRYNSQLQLMCRNYHPIGEEDLIKSGLTQREAMVFKMRFNKDCSTKASLKEVGKHFGICKERVRQIQEKALRKLKWFLYDEMKKKNKDS